ncbi:MAG TPA: enoyl-CoA hydratase-related protein [Acidimicrobiales bacterium]|jgi:2-(1,2-epoxy-1,2-dihydrophenyl)acetyl-CoA isomerase|nr:enoyl-CoA hydratase-related protein [Acidimicrobiales bacterium]
MDTVLVDRADGVVTVTLNRPEKKNAIDGPMRDELGACFREVSERREDRVVVLTGVGDAFCSGADLSAFDPNGDRVALMRRLGDIALTLHRIPKPTIAKVNGLAVGAGWNMALACDLIVASDEARFCQIFARRALSLDFGGSWLLPRLVGLHRAKELALLADMISAKEAQDLGLVNRVVAAAELDTFVAGWANRLAAGPPLALSLSKSLLNQASEVSFSQALDEEGRCQVINFGSADTAEALAAFLQKRQPNFRRE